MSVHSPANPSFAAPGFQPNFDSAIGPVVFPRWKRVFDLTLILVTAVFWLPLMVAIMYAIKIVSPGPVFFRQRRIGFRGRPFFILKFRSMKVNADTRMHERHVERLIEQGAPMIKLDAHDKRLIPFGRVFRATGLDELPQIFNVIKGEMSLIGPRPCTPNEFERYQPAQKLRVIAPPGISGYWQVHGKNRTTFDQMIAMDLKYAREMSLRLDSLIVLQTLFVLLRDFFSSLLTAGKVKEGPKQAPSEFSLEFAPVQMEK